MTFKRGIVAVLLWGVASAFFLPFFHAEANAVETVRGTVREIVSEELVFSPGIDTDRVVQIIRAELEDGSLILIENDRLPLAVGDPFFAGVIRDSSGDIYTVLEPDRREALIIATVLFAVVSIVIGGMTGLRALVSLGMSIGLIVFVLLPALASGFSPLVVSIFLSAVILGVAMVVTHGVSRTTVAAFIASIGTIVIGIGIAQFFVGFARLSGFADDTVTILNLTTGGTLNMEGILLGAMIIGILGIIDDLTITQVATVEELKSADPAMSKKELYQRAMRVGREHFGAVVNTLFLAYVGTALPLLMLFTLSPSSPFLLINSEIMAIEIIRASVGGVALALSLPLSTLLGVLIVESRFFKKWNTRHHTHTH